MRVTLLDLPENQAPIADVIDLLSQTFVSLSEVDPLVFSDLSEGTRAAIVFNCFNHRAAREFVEHPSIKVRTVQQLPMLSVGSINLRIKKSKRRTLLINRNRTLQTKAWTSGAPRALPGFDDPSVQLILTYVPDIRWSRLDRCVIGLYLEDRPISYREVDLGAFTSFDSTESGSRQEEWDMGRPLTFTDAVDSPSADELFG